ncbi:MAG: tRNA (adenosine(37)-N6)-threonylcarbamoyltransferase complex ATPase subunit type 1 TsaE [Candidatus Magasanikbacteria bacterium]|nr:tRNA (adenosine(37)-N6)-threonylcarbamoyltransferase complex ATPase subunit type 1 TsaE [Candidatus Magasanikbacteria bacterium]
MNYEKNTNGAQETTDFGKNLADKLNGGDILLLEGELGAGKTTLVKGLAAGLGIQYEITSPTFTLMNTYPVNSDKIKTLVHIDTYRLKDEEELIEIGVEDYLGKPDTLCIIEWPEKVSGLLKNKITTTITIEHDEDNQRKIYFPK